MPLSPTLSPQIKSTSPYLSAQVTIDQLQDDLLDLDVAHPSSRGNERPGKRSPRPSAVGGLASKKLGKKKARSREPVEGECHLLKLPVDLLQVLLARLPPRSLSVLSATCKTLRGDLEDESIWRQSYVYRYLGQASPNDVKVLVQPCGEDSRGWRKESLAREIMLDRWLLSKTVSSTHHPPVGLIHALSLSYPPHVPSSTKLVVGKSSTPTKSATPSSTDSPNSTAPKLTHRQKYEALLAATTRPAPYVLSASLGAGGIVRSDPLNGKVTKGYWGPGRDANFHLRPHLDHSSPPTAFHLPKRTQAATLWGLSTGTVVHTTMGMKSHASQGGRANSINVFSTVQDAHEGRVECVWAEDEDDSHWVTSGEDGCVKFWRLQPARPRSGPGKKAVSGETIGVIECLHTTMPPLIPMANRSDSARLRTTQRPDPIVLARCSSSAGIVCGVTEDGDLRVWFDILGETTEVRVDVGPAEEGVVINLCLDVVGKDRVAILIQHEGSDYVSRYDIVKDGSETRTDFVCGGAITALHIALEPSTPVAEPKYPLSILVDNNEGELLTPSPSESSFDKLKFGRFIITGDENGMASIFSWDITVGNGDTTPIRSWQAANHRITAIDANASLVAVGSCTGYINIYDPLSPSPELLRQFHANHLSTTDRANATSGNGISTYHTPNQIILEHDLVVASIGMKVFYWRAGSGRKRDAGSKGRGGRGGGGQGGGGSRGVDMRSAHKDAEDDHLALQSDVTPTKLQARQNNILGNMGIDDPDEAVQYAMMLSMEDSRGGSSVGTGSGSGLGVGTEMGVSGGASFVENEEDEDIASDGEAEALEAVRQLEEAEKREREEVLDVVRRAEMRGE